MITRLSSYKTITNNNGSTNIISSSTAPSVSDYHHPAETSTRKGTTPSSRSKSINLRNMTIRIRQTFQSTIIQPQDFLSEISRYKNHLMLRDASYITDYNDDTFNGNNNFNKTNISDNSTFTMTLATPHSDSSFPIQKPSPTKRDLYNSNSSNSNNNQYHKLDSGYKVLSNSISSNISNNNTAISNSTPLALFSHQRLASPMLTCNDGEIQCSFRFKLQNILINLQYLIRLSLLESKELSLTLSNTNDWITVLSNAFLTLLPSSLLINPSAASGYDDIELNLLLPFILELIFHLTIGNDSTDATEKFVWDLTKVSSR